MSTKLTEVSREEYIEIATGLGYTSYYIEALKIAKTEEEADLIMIAARKGEMLYDG